MELYLIRHAEISGDPHRCYQPPVSGCLSQRGRLQAEALAEALEGTRFSALYSSPLGRAIETAQSLAKPREMTIHVLPWLTEWRPATVPGKCDQTEYENLMREASKLRPEQSWKTAAGESTFEMANRVIPGFLELMESHGAVAGHGGYLLNDPEDHQRIALVAHGGSLGLLAAFLLGLPLQPYAPIALAQTAVAIFRMVRRADVWYPVLEIPAPFREAANV